jgi:hypothetical protein
MPLVTGFGPLKGQARISSAHLVRGVCAWIRGRKRRWGGPLRNRGRAGLDATGRSYRSAWYHWRRVTGGGSADAVSEG